MTKAEMTKAIHLLRMNDDQLDAAVKIQGTPHDRKRKYSPHIIYKMQQMVDSGKNYNEIAKKFNCSYNTVKYNLNDAYRKAFNAARDGKHTGKDRITVPNRVQYKRSLVAEGKI